MVLNTEQNAVLKDEFVNFLHLYFTLFSKSIKVYIEKIADYRRILHMRKTAGLSVRAASLTAAIAVAAGTFLPYIGDNSTLCGTAARTDRF